MLSPKNISDNLKKKNNLKQKLKGLVIPLANLVRPQSLKDFFGQKNLVGESSFLKEAILKDRIPSLIFWGPPGCGKTTLAFIIAKETKGVFLNFLAYLVGKKI